MVAPRDRVRAVAVRSASRRAERVATMGVLAGDGIQQCRLPGAQDRHETTCYAPGRGGASSASRAEQAVGYHTVQLTLQPGVRARCSVHPLTGRESVPERISVIIPVLNEAGRLAQTLYCLQALRERGHEVIVVDGGSTDDTISEAVPLADRVLQSPRGRARQMHAGTCAASGSVFWFLHADTLPPRAADDLILQALAVWQGDWGWFDVRLSGTRTLLRCVAWLMNRRSRLTGIATGDQGIFVRRMAYARAGGFPPIPIMEDIALSRRLRRLYRPRQIDAPLLSSSRRWEKHGVVLTIFTMWCLRLGYFLGIDPRHLARFYPGHRT